MIERIGIDAVALAMTVLRSVEVPVVTLIAPHSIPLDMQRAGAPYVYVNLTEFNGKFNFELRYWSLKNDEVIAAFAFEMTSCDPLKTVQFALAFPSVPKVDDTIALELLCDGEVIGSQRIVVTKLEKQARSSDLKY